MVEVATASLAMGAVDLSVRYYSNARTGRQRTRHLPLRMLLVLLLDSSSRRASFSAIARAIVPTDRSAIVQQARR